MTYSRMVKFGSIAAAAAFACVANAQGVSSSGLSVRLGMFLPTNSQASDLSHSWFGLGADIKINTLSVTTPVTGTEAYLGVSADYYAHGSDTDLPVALTYNIHQAPLTFSAGIGPEFRGAGDLTSNGLGIAEQIGVGYDVVKLPIPIFVQAKYFLSSRSELSGFGLYVGARF